MPALPGWLSELSESIPAWLERVAHPDGPGRYAFAVNAYEPYDLDSSALACGVVHTLGADRPERGLPAAPTAAERAAWIAYLLDLQRPEDGLLIDPGMERHIISRGAAPTAEEVRNVRRFTSRNGLTTVLELGGQPRYRMTHDEAFADPAAVVTYLDGLGWSNPWSAGSWAGAIVLFQHFNRLLGDPRAEANIAAAVEWLATHQDPATGAWSDGSDVRLNCLINGIFKVWIQVLPIAKLPVQYPERVIDLCLKGLAEDPALRDQPDACSIFDVALVLDIALRVCDHRRDEVAERARGFIPVYEQFIRPDGAFSYGPHTSLASHGGLALAPVGDHAEMAGTALHCNGLALLANLGGFRDELGWCPPTEYRMNFPSSRTQA